MKSLKKSKRKQKQNIIYSYKKVREDDLSDAEAEEIKTYMKMFGELPPLNSAIPQKKKWIKEKQNEKLK